MPGVDEGRTHNSCDYTSGCRRCHCHHCHLQTEAEREWWEAFGKQQLEGAREARKNLAVARTDLDAMLALYKDQEEELEESRSVAREILHSYPCFETTTEEEEFKRDLAEKYPWLKEDGDG